MLIIIEGGLLIRFVDSYCLGLQIKIMIIVNFACWAWKFTGLHGRFNINYIIFRNIEVT